MSLNLTDLGPIPRPHLSISSHHLPTPSSLSSSYPRIHLTTLTGPHKTKSAPRSPRSGCSPSVSPGLPPIVLGPKTPSGYGVPLPDRSPSGQNSKKAQEEKDQTAAGKLLLLRNPLARPCTSLNSLRTIATSHYSGPCRLYGPSSGSKVSPHPNADDLPRGLWTRHRYDRMVAAEGHGFDSRLPATGGIKKCQSQPAFYRPAPDEDEEEEEEEAELSVEGGRMSHDGKSGLRMRGGDDAREGNGDEELRPMERVVRWLSYVNAVAEPPPSQEDIDDEPTQTDTALHVVYDAD